MYEDATLTNGGKVLLEDSKGTCSIAGSPCISFTHTGQKGQPSAQNIENGDAELLTQISPLVDWDNIEGEHMYDKIKIK